MRTVLFLSVIAVTALVADPSFGQNRPSPRPQMAESECDGPAGAGLPGRMGQRAGRRGGMSDCPPSKEATDSAGTQSDGSTAELCDELAQRKKLTGGDRDVFIKDCIGDSAEATEASTGADSEVSELCNQVADKRKLSGSARTDFLADCASTESAESTAEKRGRSESTPGRRIPGSGGRRLAH